MIELFLLKCLYWKSPIITIEQCESIFCIMFSKIGLKCGSCILGGLYIAIMYNAFCVLSLKVWW